MQAMVDSSWIPSTVGMILIATAIMVLISRHTARVRARVSADAQRVQLLNDIPSELRFRVYERDSYTCQRCGDSRDLLVDFVDDPPADDQVQLRRLISRCARCTAITRQSGIID